MAHKKQCISHPTHRPEIEILGMWVLSLQALSCLKGSPDCSHGKNMSDSELKLASCSKCKSSVAAYAHSVFSLPSVQSQLLCWQLHRTYFLLTPSFSKQCDADGTNKLIDNDAPDHVCLEFHHWGKSPACWWRQQLWWQKQHNFGHAVQHLRAGNLQGTLGVVVFPDALTKGRAFWKTTAPTMSNTRFLWCGTLKFWKPKLSQVMFLCLCKMGHDINY